MAARETVAKDENITINGGRTETVAKDESITINGGRTETVAKDENITINGGRTESVAKDEGVSITGGRTVSVGKDDGLQVTKNLTINAGESITITTGSASISMKKDGTITINGKDITINGVGEINVKASKNITMKGQKISAELRPRKETEMELKPRIGAAPPAVVEAVPGSVDVEALLDAVTPREPAAALPGPVLGTLIGWDEAGEPLVAFRGEPLHALTTVPLSADHVGREVALLFVNGDVRRPLVIGVIQLPGPVPPRR